MPGRGALAAGLAVGPGLVAAGGEGDVELHDDQAAVLEGLAQLVAGLRHGLQRLGPVDGDRGHEALGGLAQADVDRAEVGLVHLSRARETPCAVATCTRSLRRSTLRAVWAGVDEGGGMARTWRGAGPPRAASRGRRPGGAAAGAAAGGASGGGAGAAGGKRRERPGREASVASAGAVGSGGGRGGGGRRGAPSRGVA